MISPIVQQSEKYVLDLLQKGLQPDHLFHNVAHTLEVRSVALEIAEQMQLSAEEKEILNLAALFHDVGYTEVYDGHEAVSQDLAQAYLQGQEYPTTKLQQVLACIAATRYEYQPQNTLEAIICDADLSNLGREGYLARQASLRHEWAHFRGETYSNKEWRKLNREFFNAHQFHTEVAQQMFGPTKKNNLALMKAAKKDKKGDKAKSTAPLASSKSVQVMFKTASRNHIDLTNLADNKANIMLSINAIIITITIPLLPTYLQQDMTLLLPAATLLTTCVVSVIFATLATRPISMGGITSPEQIRSGNSNLFFFGNFYKMTFSEYQEGMKTVINNEEVLEDAAIRDLYYLGAALGNKYRLLRNCYTIFMFGVTSTVLVFVLVKFINGI